MVDEDDYATDGGEDDNDKHDCFNIDDLHVCLTYV